MSHELEELIEFMTAEGEYDNLRCRFTTVSNILNKLKSVQILMKEVEGSKEKQFSTMKSVRQRYDVGNWECWRAPPLNCVDIPEIIIKH